MLLAYAAVTLLWATRTWTDTHALVAPPEVSPAFAEYECPSVFDDHPGVRGRQFVSGAPEAAATIETEYPPAGTPCDEQGKHQVLFYADLVVVAVFMGLLQRSGAHHRAVTELENAQAAVAEAEAGRSS